MNTLDAALSISLLKEERDPRGKEKKREMKRKKSKCKIPLATAPNLLRLPIRHRPTIFVVCSGASVCVRDRARSVNGRTYILHLFFRRTDVAFALPGFSVFTRLAADVPVTISSSSSSSSSCAPLELRFGGMAVKILMVISSRIISGLQFGFGTTKPDGLVEYECFVALLARKCKLWKIFFLMDVALTHIISVKRA